jgi:hypothetical protein
MLVLAIVPSAAEAFKQTRPVLEEVSIDGARVDAEAGISPSVAQALYSLLSDEARTGHRPSMYRVPQFRKLYAVTADVPLSSPDDNGICLYLFEQVGVSFRQIFRSKGMQDSYILRLTFFIGNGRTLIMGETGDESGTWGIEVFEVASGKASFLGTLYAAMRSKGDPACWLNPMLHARIDRRGGEYVIQIFGELYLHPDTKNEERLSGAGWHRFALSGSEFVYRR